MKSIAGNLKNYTLEALTHVLNGNAITTTPPTATEVGFRDVDLDIGTLVKNYAVLCRIGASPYDSPNIRTADFVSEIWYPRAFEDGQVESAFGPKATAMYAFMFEGLKSNVPANKGNLRVTDSSPHLDSIPMLLPPRCTCAHTDQLQPGGRWCVQT